MPLLDRLERTFGRFAIPGIIRYVVALNALVFLLVYLDPKYVGALTLDRDAILSGQVWRLVSWIFIPDTFSIIWVIFYLWFLWFLGDLLEAAWGTIRLNLYYLCGMVACTASAFVVGVSGGNTALNASLLLAAGTLAPDVQVLLMMIIPLRLKWLAVIAAAGYALGFVVAPLPAKAAIALSIGNYALFFGPRLAGLLARRREVSTRRARFEAARIPAAESLHRCHACGRTEISNPDLDFRVASDGHEYCVDHLAQRAR